MPLSDHEKRMLQEMEAALLTDDPRLFSALSGEAKPIGRRQVLIGLGLIVGGIATLCRTHCKVDADWSLGLFNRPDWSPCDSDLFWWPVGKE